MILTPDRTQDAYHVKHRLGHSSAINTTMRIRNSARDFEGGMKNTSHTKDDTWVIFVNPRRIREQDSINMSNQVLAVSPVIKIDIPCAS